MFRFSRSGAHLRSCISNKLLGHAGPWATFCVLTTPLSTKHLSWLRTKVLWTKPHRKQTPCFESLPESSPTPQIRSHFLPRMAPLSHLSTSVDAVPSTWNALPAALFIETPPSRPSQGSGANTLGSNPGSTPEKCGQAPYPLCAPVRLL